MRPALLMMLAGLWLGPGVHAAAQDVDAAAVADRAPAELQCLQAAQGQLEQAIRLLRQSYAQLRSASDPRLRRDAARAIVSLEQRIDELARDMRQCVRSAATAGEGSGVVVVEAPQSETEKAVAQPNPATDVVERDRYLGPHLHVVVGEKVDGHGRVPEQSVRDAITNIARPLSACYGRLVDRGALQRGELVLLFTVTPDGRVRHVKVERGTIGNRAFARCVIRGAQRRMRRIAPSVGGEATYSYTFRFGPD